MHESKASRERCSQPARVGTTQAVCVTLDGSHNPSQQAHILPTRRELHNCHIQLSRSGAAASCPPVTDLLGVAVLVFVLLRFACSFLKLSRLVLVKNKVK